MISNQIILIIRNNIFFKSFYSIMFVVIGVIVNAIIRRGGLV